MEKIFVARRFDRAPHLQILFYAYSETLRSKPFEINGVLANTMFCKKQTTLNRLIKNGWKDCTREYLIQLEKQKEETIEKAKKTENKTKRGRPKTVKGK